MNILERIVEDKKLELIDRKITMPLFTFQDGVESSTRDFYQALKSDYNNYGSGVILEIKKASPSKGLIREEFDLEEICSAYKESASCVSVLTDEKYFSGDFERLPKVRELLPQPLLCKDFFIDSYQVYLARLYGADAILLMLSVLDDNTYKSLHAVANELGLDVLTEVSNKDEMLRAVNLNANIIGINNRKLRDLSTDLNQTPKLVAVFNEITTQKQKTETLLISESGIYNHQQVKQLSPFVHGFLVGSSIMAQDDLILASKDLICGQHKVCGMTRSEDIISALAVGAKYIGLIFAEQSPRKVTLDQAKSLTLQVANNLTKLNLPNYVAVVQNQSIDFVISIAQQLPIAAIQLHGDEDQTYIDNLKTHLSEMQNNKTLRTANNIEIWKAVSIAEGDSLPVQHVNQSLDSGRSSLKWPDLWLSVDKIVLDSKSKTGQQGGTGKAFDWEKLAPLAVLSATNNPQPTILLAGGLNTNNISEAISLPIIGCDFNSGLETEPGVKSESLMTNAFRQIMRRIDSRKENYEHE